MANIRTLSVSITAKTSSFTKGLARARKQLAGFASTIPLLNTSVTSMGAGFAAAATAGIAYMTRESMQAIDAAGKLSDQLGLTTEQLTGYQYAASLADVSNEELTKGFLRLQKSVSEAAAGDQLAGELFKELGLNAQALFAMSPAQQFEVATDALAGLANQADRTRIAQELFGRSGFKMLSMLKGGSAELRTMQAEARRMGVTFSRDAAAGVEAANDSITRAKAGLVGIANQIAIAVAPAITDLATRFTNLDLRSWGQQAGQAVTDAYQATLKWAKDGNLELWFERVKAAWLGMKLVGITVWEGLNGAMQLWIAGFKAEIGIIVGLWDKAIGHMKQVAGAFIESFGTHLLGVPGLDSYGRKMHEFAGSLKAEGGGQQGNAFRNEWLKEAGAHFDKAVDGGDAIAKAAEEFAKQAQRVADLQGVVARNEAAKGISNDPLMGGIIGRVIAESVGMAKQAMQNVGTGTVAAAKVAQGAFEQIDLSRVSVSALAGMGRTQKTEDVNGKKQVKLLERLVQQGEEDPVAVAG